MVRSLKGYRLHTEKTLWFHSVKIFVLDHCIQQIKIRKGKKNDKSALFFAIDTFQEMIRKNQYRGTECKIKKGKLWREIIYHKETWYKFVFKRERDLQFTLITFAIHTELDFEIGKLMKRLHMIPSDARIIGQKHGSIEFETVPL